MLLDELLQSDPEAIFIKGAFLKTARKISRCIGAQILRVAWQASVPENAGNHSDVS